MKLAIVAGEASGDLHASEVVRELKTLDAGLTLFGIGGDFLAREGMTLLHHAREMGIVGLFNVLRHLGMFRRVFKELIERIEQERPDVVLLVDYPEFNLRVAKRCKELGLRVVYYISPQLWAWRKGRVRQIARYVDRMVVIFPFEEEFYRKHDVPVTYVGHPLIEQLGHVEKPPRDPDELRIALLPGSRRMEVLSLLPPMLDAVQILRGERNVNAYVIQARPFRARSSSGSCTSGGSRSRSASTTAAKAWPRPTSRCRRPGPPRSSRRCWERRWW
jgi:lipid-A-disaccharide synthase